MPIDETRHLDHCLPIVQRSSTRVFDWLINLSVMLVVATAIPWLLLGQSDRLALWCRASFVTAFMIRAIIALRFGSIGATYFRLPLALDWGALTFRVSATIYLAYVAFVNTNRLLAMGVYSVIGGIACGLFLYGASRVLAARRVEIGENGVFIRATLCWPWGNITRAMWQRSDKTHLTLYKGIHRIIVVVPNEQQRSVQALLNHKLGLNAPLLPKSIPSAAMNIATDIESEHVPTDARFSVRSLLVLMLCTAILSPVLGWFVRQFPPDARLLVASCWIFMVLLLFCTVAIYARIRRRAERLAGPVIFELVPHSYLLPRAPGIVTAVIGSGLILLGLILWGILSADIGISPSRQRSEWVHRAWLMIWSAGALAGGISHLWWHRRVRVCRRGVVVRHYFRPWSRCGRYYWDACNRNVIVLEWNSQEGDANWGPRRVAANVPEENRAPLEEILREQSRAGQGKAGITSQTANSL